MVQRKCFQRFYDISIPPPHYITVVANDNLAHTWLMTVVVIYDATDQPVGYYLTLNYMLL